jgi:hypothetical protein
LRPIATQLKVSVDVPVGVHAVVEATHLMAAALVTSVQTQIGVAEKATPAGVAVVKVYPVEVPIAA